MAHPAIASKRLELLAHGRLKFQMVHSTSTISTRALS
jgi:hypothetical protein